MFCGLCNKLPNASEITGRLHSGLKAYCPNQNCNRYVYWPNKKIHDKAVERAGFVTDIINQSKHTQSRRGGGVDTNFPIVDISIGIASTYSIDISS